MALQIAGKRFGRLVVIEKVESCDQGTRWLCVCDCGKESIVVGKYLTSGNTRSCGCLVPDATRKAKTTHGHTKGIGVTTTYNSWVLMLGRCYNENNQQYDDYGGRGITVCERWRYSYTNFLRDMGERPTGLLLDRIDNNKGYSPDNCRWTDRTTQNRNRRNTLFAERYGERKTVAEWAEILGVKYDTLKVRLWRTGSIFR